MIDAGLTRRMVRPNFIIIGVPKAGTTSLYDFCGQHPDAFLPSLKEPRFFSHEGESISPMDPVNRRTVTTWDAYLELFSGATTQRAIGEASPGYFASPKACAEIQRWVPGAKLIVVLRDPAERAFSHFYFALRQGFEPPDATFEEAITERTVRVDGWTRTRDYVDTGFYHRHLTRWHDAFPAEQIKVCLFEDLAADATRLARNVYSFLEIDDSFVPETSVKYAKSGVPRNRLAHALLRRPPKPLRALARWIAPERARRLRTRALNWNLEKPEMSAEMRERLVSIFREDTLRLQERLQRDLSPWLRA